MALTLRQKGLIIVNKLRQLPTKFDLRRYTLNVITTTWTGSTIGEGTSSSVSVPLVLDGYGTLPRVTKISSADIIASGGLYSDGDYRIDLITPADPSYTGGVNVSTFEPPINASPTEVYFQMFGPEFPSGALFKKKKTDTDRNFSYSFVLEKLGTP